jgi:NitT/TauT family transport system permease protein
LAQPIATLVIVAIAWELAVRIAKVPAWLLPPPSSILGSLSGRFEEIPGHFWNTVLMTLAGFFAAMVGGMALAILIFYLRPLQNTLMPILVVFQAVPKVALAPLLLIWVGYGEPSIVTIAFLVAFFPMVVGTFAGLRSVEREAIDLSRTLSATEWQMFWKVRLPAALPFIFSSAKVAITLALIGAVIGEFVSSNKGLGYLVLISSTNLNTALAFGAIVILGIIGIVLYYAVEVVERLTAPWIAEGQ